MYPKFKQHRPQDAKMMESEDREFSGLYSLVTLYKVDKRRR